MSVEAGEYTKAFELPQQRIGYIATINGTKIITSNIQRTPNGHQFHQPIASCIKIFFK
jgi:hypothetical protein